ncbi:MAG: hypothetical protein AW07_04772 [Candidatus Accumulibacter sp. SK-11]|nr:MAG: hypothetical protein AW07_04772 [Candidatus Accumulibacter sp. SK-11]
MLNLLAARAVLPARSWRRSFARGRSLLWLPLVNLVGSSPLPRSSVGLAFARQVFAASLRRLRAWDGGNALLGRLVGPRVLDVLLHGTPLRRGGAPLSLRGRRCPLHRALLLVLPNGGVAGLVAVVLLVKRLLPWPIGILIPCISTLVDR